MKIAIPTEGSEGKEAKVYGHFGSAPFFTIYDDVSEDVTIVENANMHHEHGMCNPVGNLDGYDINAVVSGGMGMRAMQKLNNAGIKVYIAQTSTVAETITAFKDNKISEMSADSACGGHAHGCD